MYFCKDKNKAVATMNNHLCDSQIKLLYYETTHPAASGHRLWIMNWLAKVATGSTYVHVELEFEGRIYSLTLGNSMTVTQAALRKIENTAQIINIRADQAQKLRKFLNDHKDIKFNYFGYFLWPFWSVRGLPDRAFCAEFVVAALQSIGGFTFDNEKPQNFSPGRLFFEILDRGYGRQCVVTTETYKNEIYVYILLLFEKASKYSFKNLISLFFS